jgi:ketosteroid isomerase-like protein
MASERVEALRSGYEAFNRGEVEGLLGTAAPDFVARDRAELPDPRTHRGLEGAAEALRRAREGFDEYRIDPQEFIERGDHVVVVARQTGRGSMSGAEVTGAIVHLWGYRGDRIVSLQAYSDREQALAALEQRAG